MDVAAVRPFGGELEAGAVDDAVDRIVGVVGDDGGWGDVGDPDAFGVDEVDVGLVECVEILVVKAGAFAELVVPDLKLAYGVMTRKCVDRTDQGFRLSATLLS